MSVKHTIFGKDGGTEEVTLTPLLAIVKHCIMCFGFEDDPEMCTCALCPLFPFRTGDGHSGKKLSTAQKSGLSVGRGRAGTNNGSKSLVCTSENGQKTRQKPSSVPLSRLGDCDDSRGENAGGGRII